VKILVIDVGGTHVRILATGERDHREVDSEPTTCSSDFVTSGSTSTPSRRSYNVMVRQRS
jgi:hexokinase